jgi:hypothetical protein
MSKEKSDWRTIPGYPDYQINQFGEVKSVKFGKERILKQRKQQNYMRVNLFVNSKMSVMNVHILMGITFLEYNFDNKNMVIDHIDNNGRNNQLNNLQIISHRQNCTKDKKPKSGYTGVYKHWNKWRSFITHNNKQIYLGTYPTPEEASQAYQDYLSKLNEE